MLIVLSPAKRLNYSEAPTAIQPTVPRFDTDIAELAKVTRKLTRADLRRLMDISEPLANLNHERFQAFDPDNDGGALPAAFAFAGDVYEGLKARELDKKALTWTQEHLRILSGLYGLLRPLDAIQPYRLEMGARLRTRRGANLYDFWGDRIAKGLNADAEGHADPSLVNLASQEYFGAVDARALKLPVVTPQFRELRDGESRIISFFAKKARGLMARWAVDNRVERAEDLKGFNLEGYGFDKAASSESDWIFIRSGKS